MHSTPMRQSKAVREGQQATEVPAVVLINEQLACDEPGTLRDQMLDELAIAAQDIEAALSACSRAAEADVLRDLLQAVRLGERLLVQVWDSYHG